MGVRLQCSRNSAANSCPLLCGIVSIRSPSEGIDPWPWIQIRRSTSLVRIQVNAARLATDRSSPLARSFQPGCAEVSLSIPTDFSAPIKLLRQIVVKQPHGPMRTANLGHTGGRESRIIVGNVLCRHSYGEALQHLRYGYPCPFHGRPATKQVRMADDPSIPWICSVFLSWLAHAWILPDVGPGRRLRHSRTRSCSRRAHGEWHDVSLQEW